jgi:hypothetical protein
VRGIASAFWRTKPAIALQPGDALDEVAAGIPQPPAGYAANLQRTMNAPHWHLAINHIPVVGVFLVVILLGYALARGRGELYGVSLGALVLLALATIPVFFTGRRADDVLMDFADVDEKLVHIHEAAANLAFTGIGILGAVALVALWVGRKLPHVSRGIATVIFLLALGEAVLMARTANLGGQIRHPEIRAASAAPGTPDKGGHD